MPVTESKVIVITGASDGIGAAAARTLTNQGHRVVIVGRSPEKTERVANALDAPFLLADFTRLDDVRVLAGRLLDDVPRIDVLMNNAGGVMGPRTLTADGNELTTQVNHLAQFLLTDLLLERLIASRATVITTASVAHRSAAPLDLADPAFAHHYSPMRAYSRAKLMNILFARELHRRHHGAGLRSAAFHPGVVNTNFSSEFGGLLNVGFTSVARRFFRSPARGADTGVWLATTEEWQSGEYYKDRRIHRSTRQSRDPEIARDLWELSAALTRSP